MHPVQQMKAINSTSKWAGGPGQLYSGFVINVYLARLAKQLESTENQNKNSP